MDIPEILQSLSQVGVYDNAYGNASATRNKSSVYLVHHETGIVARICNISTTNIDGHGDPGFHPVDDFSLCYLIVAEMIAHCVKCHELKDYTLTMNPTVYNQLVVDWYKESNVGYPGGFRSFMSINIDVDDSIQCNEDTVL